MASLQTSTKGYYAFGPSTPPKMTGKHAPNTHCPLCGGIMKHEVTTLPFLLRDGAFLVDGVPAEVCQAYHEPFMIGEVVSELTALLNRVG